MTYLSRVREHLAESRRHGKPFDVAWRDAMEAHPNTNAYAYGQGNGTGRPNGKGESPIHFARRMFERAYYGHDIPGGEAVGAVLAVFEDDALERGDLGWGRRVA